MPGMPSSKGSEHKDRDGTAYRNYRDNFDRIFNRAYDQNETLQSEYERKSFDDDQTP